MFSLSPKELGLNIISCGDGPASFNYGMKERGHKVISCDPIYAFSAGQIRSRIKRTYASVMEQLKGNEEAYVWTTFKNPEEVGRVRMKAMNAFLEDYPHGKKEGRYLAECLPHISFNNDRFDLALCSHLLFLYSKHLSLDFHIASITEMLRVSKEVRIFPLLELSGGKSPYLKDVISEFRGKGHEVATPKVNYEFQRGGDMMLRISR
ncbi:MAG: SAM-dependent methyltransferase [Candidatus Omnitrophica bacterium]|nr:SAM-dependent methyltransferase [Candidatus Omnitrophota bacterium]